MSTYPLPRHVDGRKACVSDGFHTLDDLRLGRSKRQHRGADIMFRKLLPSKPQHPHSSKWYEIPKPLIHGGYDVPVLAVGTGMVAAAGRLNTGCWVALDLGGGVGVAYHHLSRVLVQPGLCVGEGTPLGFVGGSPVGYGLWHLHFDYATGCRWEPARLAKICRLDGTFGNPAPFLATCRHVTLAESWGELGHVS